MTATQPRTQSNPTPYDYASATSNILAQVAGYFGQRRYAAEMTAALADAGAASIAALADRAEQINASAQDLATENARVHRAERGYLSAVSGEGFGGNSWQRVFAASRASEGEAATTIEANRRAAQRQNVREAESVRAQIRTQSLGIRRPNLFTLSANIAESIGAVASKAGGK